jgi:hypothetical protein
MADAVLPSVSVLCAYPVSPLYDASHRYFYYACLAVILALPRHKWVTPAAFAFVTLYSVFSTLYVGALAIAPTRLGPSLDIFPLSSLFLTNTYALAAGVFCRTKLIKGKRGWLRCVRSFVWLWIGFITANLTKSMFEKMAQRVAVDVQCYAEDSATAPANIFSIGNGISCENPCAIPATSALHRIQEQLTPILWGSVDSQTKEFTQMPIPSLTTKEYAVVILFAVALASTLWLNFFTSPQITRNTIFAALTRGKTDSRVRVSMAKIAALVWFGWSYFTLLLVALAVPFISYVQEKILAKYPVEKTSLCAMAIARQWLPWIVAVAVFMIKIAFWRRRREAMSKEKACRIRRFNTALRQLQASTDQVSLLPGHHIHHESQAGKGCAAEIREPSPSVPQETVKHSFSINEPRKVDGVTDTLGELKDWWKDPAGTPVHSQDENSPAADEEKALLGEHFEEEN